MAALPTSRLKLDIVFRVEDFVLDVENMAETWQVGSVRVEYIALAITSL